MNTNQTLFPQINTLSLKKEKIKSQALKLVIKSTTASLHFHCFPCADTAVITENRRDDCLSGIIFIVSQLRFSIWLLLAPRKERSIKSYIPVLITCLVVIINQLPDLQLEE